MVGIQQIEVALRPAFEGAEEDPAPVGGRGDVDDVLLRPFLSKDEPIPRGVVAEAVVADPAVVVLVTRRHRSGRRMDGVVETAGHPRDRAPPRMRDPVGEVTPSRGLQHMQRRHLVAAARKAVRDVPRVRRRVIPVDRDEAVPIERIRVDEHTVRGVDRVAHVQHGLALLPLPPHVEDASGDGTRRREQTHRQQLAESRSPGRALRQRIENRSRPCVLPIRPFANAVGRVRFEPAVRVGDLRAMHIVDDVIARGARRGRKRHVSRVSRSAQTGRR